MTTDYRALCAELIAEIDEKAWGISSLPSSIAIDRARAALAEQPENDPSQISDGFHTFAELYEHRHALTLSLMKAKPELFWFSRKHNDGELCFGTGDWFIIGAELPAVGSITYHLPMALWESAQRSGAAMLKIGRLWDGHTPEDVVERLKAWAALAEQPVGEGPPAVTTGAWLHPAYEPGDGSADGAQMVELAWWHPQFGCDSLQMVVDNARAVLARWGNPAPQPVPVSERPWERQGWCDKDGRCWFGWADEPDASWSFCKPSERDTATVSIPANALPLPKQEVSE